jgi:hypothetical protein
MPIDPSGMAYCAHLKLSCTREDGRAGRSPPLPKVESRVYEDSTSTVVMVPYRVLQTQAPLS